MAHLFIAIVTSLAIIVIAIFARISTYHAAPFFLVPVVSALYALRRQLHLSPFNYGALASAILLHMIGAFGYYQESPLPFSFDILVHFYFALVIALALYEFLERGFPLRRWHRGVLTFFIMMGLASLHEVMEYASHLMLGDRGMLKTTSYVFDTSRDLTNNLFGTLSGLLVIAAKRLIQSRRARDL